MKATIRIYSKSKQTKGKDGDKVTTIAERTIITHTYEVKGTLPISKKLAQIEHFATRTMGARVAALLSAGKKAPAKMFLEYQIDGKVFSTETVLVKAQLVNTISLSMKGLSGKSKEDIIDSVAATQVRGIRASIGYLQDVAQIAKDASKIGEALGGASLMVASDGELVEDEAPTEQVEVEEPHQA
jgi:hypothetical protein